ncbi:MAG: hypothetical protein LC099_10885 [Anaerolineales bacterium]|nr:hypothetical protein [Anaerolineales bacterium]
MKKQTPLLSTFSLILFLLAACAPKQIQLPDEFVKKAVSATLTALPAPTQSAPPTALPAPTAFSLAGLFCEYQFCIGHPLDVAFFDVSAKQSSAPPNTYSQGILAGLNGKLFIQLIWQLSPGSSNPQFLFDAILNDAVDVAAKNSSVFLVRGMNVVYDDISSTATSTLPYGGGGAWTCGDRVFAWKVYTPQAENARPLFDAALDRFICE